MNGVMGHIEWGWGPLDGLLFGTDGELGGWIAAAAGALIMFGALFSALKGKYGFVLLALTVPGPGTVLAIIGGVRLAKPRSFWARHFYDRGAIAEAIARHEPPINLDAYPERKLRKGYERPLNNPSTDHVG